MKRVIALLLALVLAIGIFVGCGSEQADDSKKDDKQTESQSSEKTTLVYGTSADYPPFEYHILDENGNDQTVGIDVSLARKIAEDMGMELQIVDMSFDNLMTSLQKGECDIVIAAVEEDEERLKVADFSDPYYTDYPPVIVALKENADQYTSLEDFAGKTVGAQNATTKADIVTEQMTGANLLSLANVTDLINNLVYNKCDAVVLDGAVAEQYVATNDQLAIVDVDLGEAAPYRVAVAKGDPSGLLEQINKTIATILEDGTMDKYIEEANALSDQAVE